MSALSKPLTTEEARCIKDGEPLFVEKLSVHGTYKDGTPFVREYEMGVHLHQADRIMLNYVLEYPDPLWEAMNPRAH
jgi:hypothetical protein